MFFPGPFGVLCWIKDGGGSCVRKINLDSTCTVYFKSQGAQLSAQGPLKEFIVLFLHLIARLTGQICLFRLRSGSCSLPVSISEYGVDLSSTWLWAVVKVLLQAFICLLDIQWIQFFCIYRFLLSGFMLLGALRSKCNRQQGSGWNQMFTLNAIEYLTTKYQHCTFLSIIKFEINWTGIFTMKFFFKFNVMFLLFLVHISEPVDWKFYLRMQNVAQCICFLFWR